MSECVRTSTSKQTHKHSWVFGQLKLHVNPVTKSKTHRYVDKWRVDFLPFCFHVVKPVYSFMNFMHMSDSKLVLHINSFTLRPPPPKKTAAAGCRCCCTC